MSAIETMTSAQSANHRLAVSALLAVAMLLTVVLSLHSF
jgi:hypothetical protein